MRPWSGRGRALAQRVDAGAAVAAALNDQGAPVRFVAQDALPHGHAYEAHIFATACVPTRDNLHDFFNGLMWLHFPQTKLKLNRLQAAEIAVHGVGPARGPLRDALTLFDENAALLQAPEPLWQALRARDWHRLFIDERSWWAQARLRLFGHALLEKLVLPYKSITAHVFVEPVPMALGDDPVAWDGWLADRLQASHLATKPYTPLPVLGVPGWWTANAQADFYDDPQVFRAPRGPRVFQ